MQVNVEGGALVPCNVHEKQVQMNVEVGKTSSIDLATIEVDLQKTIEMIAKQENVAFAFVQKENEHVIRHVEIDASDIFILTYNLLATHPLYLKGWVGFFWQIYVCNIFINFGFQIFGPPSFSM